MRRRCLVNKDVNRNKKRGKPPGRQKFWTDRKIAAALVQGRGVITEAAKILAKSYGRKCVRQTIANLVNDSPELLELAIQSREALVDLCESGIIRRAEAGDQKDQHLIVTTIGKARGWSRGTVVTGPNNGPVLTKEVAPDTLAEKVAALSTDELNRWERVLEARIASGEAATP